VGNGSDRVVRYREKDDARVGDPRGRSMNGAYGECEGLGDGLRVPTVQQDAIPGLRECEREPDARTPRPDDPHDGPVVVHLIPR
jgi:hypothetical protein